MNPSPEARAAERLEAARKFFAGEIAFAGEARTLDLLPPPRGPEVAFAGRSNVGKSSLINALAGRKGLARASAEPGRTRALNFFIMGGGALFLVDLPGYGYAAAPKTEIARWTSLTGDYLRGRPNLRRVFLLIDARHGAKPGDLAAMDAFDRAAVSYALVLTKADKIRPAELAAGLMASQTLIARRPAAYPELFPTSAETGYGIETLRAAVADLAQTAP